MHTQTTTLPDQLAALAVEIHQNADIKTFAVTGTFHGSIVQAKTEGEARRIFHRCYNGESVLSVTEKMPMRGIFRSSETVLIYQ